MDDATQGTVSFAVSVNEHSGNTKTLASLAGGRLLVQLVTNLTRVSVPRLVLRSAANEIIAQIDMLMEVPQFSARLPIVMMSWDLAREYEVGFRCFLAEAFDPTHDISVRPAAPSRWLQGQSVNLAYSGGDNRLFGAGGNPVTGDPDIEAGMFWFSPTFIDLNERSRRAAFRPGMLGMRGQKPTGDAPLLYVTGDHLAHTSSSGINLGIANKFVAQIGTGCAILPSRTPDAPLPVGSPTGLRPAGDPPKPGYIRLYCDDFKRRPPSAGRNGYYGKGQLNEGGRQYKPFVHYPPYNFNTGTGERNVFVREDGVFVHGQNTHSVDPAHYVPFEFSDPDGVGILKINAGSVKESDLALMGQPYWGGMFQTRDWVCPTDCWLEFGYRFPEAPWGRTLDGLFGALWCLGNNNGRAASGTYLEVDILEQIGRLTGRQGAYLPMGIWGGTSSNNITKYKLLNDFNQRGLYGPWSKVGIDVNAAGITFWHNADMFGLSASDNANSRYASFARNPKFLIANMSSGNGTALVQGQPPAPGKTWFNNRITPLTWQQGKCLYLDYIDVWVPNDGTQKPFERFIT